ncbi:hypothetical protein Lser_V15G41225 [Lactuca serriola]
MENLRGEILSDIFIRLLAQQLAQMRCVYKSWNALLSESSFIKSHPRRSTHNNNDILLFFHCSFVDDLFIRRHSCSPDIKLTRFYKLPVNTQFESSSYTVIGSVNGLICFYYKSYNDDYLIHIWNPSLSAVLALPPSSLSTPMSKKIYLRFGFDPKTDDYKVVKFTSLFQHPTR